MFGHVNLISAEPEPDSTAAESEPADPESERAPTGKNSQPTGQKAQLHHVIELRMLLC